MNSDLRSGGGCQALVQTAFLARGGVLMNDAFGGGAVDGAERDVRFTGERFFGFGFNAGFYGAIDQTLFGVLTQAFLSGFGIWHFSFVS